MFLYALRRDTRPGRLRLTGGGGVGGGEGPGTTLDSRLRIDAPWLVVKRVSACQPVAMTKSLINSSEARAELLSQLRISLAKAMEDRPSVCVYVEAYSLRTSHMAAAAHSNLAIVVNIAVQSWWSGDVVVGGDLSIRHSIIVSRKFRPEWQQSQQWRHSGEFVALVVETAVGRPRSVIVVLPCS